MLATLPVTLRNDAASPTDLDGGITLREAITYVNTGVVPDGDQALFDYANLGTNDTIIFDSSLNGDKIEIQTANGFGQFLITKPVTIDASMLSMGITIDGTNGADHMPGTHDGSSVFQVNLSNIGNPEVTFNNLTITGGDQNSSGGAIKFLGNWNPNTGDAGVLNLIDCLITGNTAYSTGGGIHASLGEVNLSNTIVKDNTSSGGGGGMYLSDVPQATITASKFINNTANLGSSGGGLAIVSEISSSYSHVVTIQESEFVDNKAIDANSFTGNGGGIYANLLGFDDSTETTQPKLEIIDSTVSENNANNDGGGIWTCTKYGAAFTMMNSTVSGNTAGTSQDSYYPEDPPIIVGGHGGGVWLAVVDYHAHDPLSADLVNSTFSDNEALAKGGGVWLGIAHPSPALTGGSIEANLDSVTIFNSRSPDGGGMFSEPDNPLHRITTTLNNTIVSGNVVSEMDSTANNIGGRIELDSSYNLIGPGDITSATLNNSTGTGNVNNASNAPLLAPLAFNGGPTRTHAPLYGSPTIDAGDPSVVAGMNGVPDFDQRGEGFTRVYNGDGLGDARIDIGAHEVGLAKVVNVTISGSESDHEPFSFDDPSDDEHDFDGSGIQLRTVPVGGADTVAVKFSENMSNVASTSLKLTGLSTAAVPALASGGFGFDSSTQSYQWKFDAPLSADQYLIAHY